MSIRAILVVDANEDLAENLTEILELESYVVTVLGTSASARNRLTTGDVPVVLTDLQLPDGTGMELALWIRTRRPSTRVIIMSAFTRAELDHDRAAGDTGTKLRALDAVKPAGAMDPRELLDEVMATDGVELLEKPFSAEALLTRVAAAFEGR